MYHCFSMEILCKKGGKRKNFPLDFSSLYWRNVIEVGLQHFFAVWKYDDFLCRFLSLLWILWIFHRQKRQDIFFCARNPIFKSHANSLWLNYLLTKNEVIQKSYFILQPLNKILQNSKTLTKNAPKIPHNQHKRSQITASNSIFLIHSFPSRFSLFFALWMNYSWLFCT